MTQLGVRVGRTHEGGYRASSPYLPGCIGLGRDHQEALSRFNDAAMGYLAAVNNSVPEPVRLRVGAH